MDFTHEQISDILFELTNAGSAHWLVEFTLY